MLRAVILLAAAVGAAATHPLLHGGHHTGYHGGAGMVSIELVSAGTAWIDDVVLTLKNNTRA